MRSQMYFPTVDDNNHIIISIEPPIEYKEQKNIIMSRTIKKEEYDEVYEYLNEQNKMISGVYTLLPKQELAKYMHFDALSVLMRTQIDNSLIGTILSIPFPIKCENDIINHGCTTYLNVHSKLRGHGLCMALIRELSQFAYEQKLYCSYSLTSFPLSTKSFEIVSWYRPINIPVSIGLGFSYPNWNQPSKFSQNKVKYNTKCPKKYVCNQVLSKNVENAYKFYMKINENKKFVFYPDITLFSKWIENYPTYTVLFDKKIVGIFSINSVYCKMENNMEGKLCLPLLFNAYKEHSSNVFKCCIFIANERQYDVLYTHCVGDITRKILEENNAIETPRKSYFSLYNNSMDLTSEEIYVPLL